MRRVFDFCDDLADPLACIEPRWRRPPPSDRGRAGRRSGKANGRLSPPSAIASRAGWPAPVALDAGADEIQASSLDACARCAHGLDYSRCIHARVSPAEFLSPFDRLDDAYGGSLETRMRFREISLRARVAAREGSAARSRPRFRAAVDG